MCLNTFFHANPLSLLGFVVTSRVCGFVTTIYRHSGKNNLVHAPDVIFSISLDISSSIHVVVTLVSIIVNNYIQASRFLGVHIFNLRDRNIQDGTKSKKKRPIQISIKNFEICPRAETMA